MFGVVQPIAHYGMPYASFETAQQFSLAFPTVIVRNGNYRMRHGLVLNPPLDQIEFTHDDWRTTFWREGDERIYHSVDDQPSREWTVGDTFQQQWHHTGLLHRIGGPADVTSRNGIVAWEQWMQHGKHHREDGPASILYDKHGNAEVELYYLHGKHQSDPPNKRRRLA